MENAVYIYGLLDPRDNRCRYIGKTDDPERRAKEYLGAKDFSHRTCWLRSLAAAGLEPQLKILEECPSATWQARERWWIASLQVMGADLVNGSEGGMGGSKKGHVTSPEGRARITEAVRKARIGTHHTAETKAKMSAAKKGKPQSPKALEATRRNLEKARVRFAELAADPKTRSLVVKSHKGLKRSAETKRRIAKSNAGSYPALKNLDTGEIVPPGKNMSEFCRQHNLFKESMNRILKGKAYSTGGWTLAEPHPKLRRCPDLINLWTGETVLAGRVLAEFCRERKLNPHGMTRLIEGKLSVHMGWTIHVAGCDVKELT